MEAHIWLDEDYNSGLDGAPGARFVIDLQKPPITDFNVVCEANSQSKESILNAIAPEPSNYDGGKNGSGSNRVLRKHSLDQIETEVLPESLSVLFVDDETILRKLFVRTVHRVAPTWTVEEASNGDRALQLMSQKEYDIVFMDQVCFQ